MASNPKLSGREGAQVPRLDRGEGGWQRKEPTCHQRQACARCRGPSAPVRDAGGWREVSGRRKDGVLGGAPPPPPRTPQVGSARGAGGARRERRRLSPPGPELPVGGQGGRGRPRPSPQARLPPVPAGLRAPGALPAGAPAERPETPAAETRAHGAGAAGGRGHGRDGRGQWFLVSWHRAQKTQGVPCLSALQHLPVSSALPSYRPGAASRPSPHPHPRPCPGQYPPLRGGSQERVAHSPGVR